MNEAYQRISHSLSLRLLRFHQYRCRSIAQARRYLFGGEDRERRENRFQSCSRILPIGSRERHPDRIHVFLLDGYNAHSKLPADAIDVAQINPSDGGKNRQFMHLIGRLGLRSIFAALGLTPPQPNIREMRRTPRD